MDQIVASSNQILEVNLSVRSFHTFLVSPQDRRLYLGGKGLGLSYLYQRLPPGVDSFSPENILVFMMGVYLGTKATCGGRFSGLTKSPLTGIMVHCSCGGPFGMAFKTAGYEGLLVTGKAEHPLYLEIQSDHVDFVDASHLWGLDTVQTQQALDLGKKDGALTIGPAGENRVWYANIASGNRFLGRGGMGAVMGSKNLKAVVARGGVYTIAVHQPERFSKLLRKANKRVTSNFYTGFQFRNYGTRTNINLSNQAVVLPVENFQQGSSSLAGQVSGETMKARFNPKFDSCYPCSILCGHKGTYPSGVYKIPEYETTAMLGPNTGNFDPLYLAEWNDLCSRLGMDTISAGGTLAYTMEASHKGLLKSDLAFGSPQGISQMLQDIAYRRGLGDELANGSRWLAQKYGGLDFAIQVKGLEMAAYDPRGACGQGLSYAVANRGACHLTGGIFPLEAYYHFLNPFSIRAKAKLVWFYENAIAAINSMHACLFTIFGYLLEAPIVKLMPKPVMAFAMQYLPTLSSLIMDINIYKHFYESIMGIKLSRREFLQAGERIVVLERWMNTREGIRRADDTLPKRFLEEGRGCDPQKHRVPLDKMLPEYYRLRGYNPQGIPEQALLDKLQIEKR